MAQFSKFILSCMIVLAGASISTSLHSMQTDPLSSSSAGLCQRSAPENRTELLLRGERVQEAPTTGKTSTLRQGRRREASYCEILIYGSLFAGAYMVYHLSTQGLPESFK